VRLAAVGLCRTDYHVMRGERRVAMSPMVLGHEGAGIVETDADPRMLTLYRQGELKLRKLVTRTYRQEDINAAMPIWTQARTFGV
jgi:Zn-dependent alcohol dehydrogenase